MCHGIAQRKSFRGHAVGTIDVRGHTPPGGKHSRLPLAITGRALWNWAQVCRALPKITLDYDRVILAYGEGPPLPVPTLTLRHSPTLFATDARLLACVGARPTDVRRAYIQLCRRVAGPIAGPHQTTTLCNTRWTAQICADVAGFPSDGILYPKVDRPTAPLNMRKPYRVLILGRIVPNKRIEDAIAADPRRGTRFDATRERNAQKRQAETSGRWLPGRPAPR